MPKNEDTSEHQQQQQKKNETKYIGQCSAIMKRFPFGVHSKCNTPFTVPVQIIGRKISKNIRNIYCLMRA